MDFYKSKNELYFSAVIDPAFKARDTGLPFGYRGGEVIRRAKLLQVDVSERSPGIRVVDDHGYLCEIKITQDEFMKAHRKAKKIVRDAEKIFKDEKL